MPQRIVRMRRFAIRGGLLLFALLAIILYVYPAAAAQLHLDSSRQSRVHTFRAQTLLQRIQSHQLASTVQVLDSQAPTVIIQFPLFPSGVKKAFPQATGVVTIVQGNPAISLFDTVTVDVAHMPADTTFTIFFIELANKPFGHVQYVSDLHTRSDGSGDVTFQTITLVAFADDVRTPVTSADQTGDASGIQLEHMGMWFSSLQDAQKALNDTTLKGTPFDGGNPANHAGPQAMTDGQTTPVF